MRWHQDLPIDSEQKKFVIKHELIDESKSIITVQSFYMREVLLENTSGLQSDTIEGIIFDSEYPGIVDVHFTSGFDKINCRWVPVLMSLIFGRTKEHYASHFKSLFASYGEEINSSWESFTAVFPGTTMDWSAALGAGFLEALLDHAFIYSHWK